MSLLLGLRWYDQRQLVSVHVEPPERVTKVPHGGTGTFRGLEWRLLDAREVRKAETAGAVGLHLTLQVKPLDAAGVQELTKSRLTYQVRDPEGRVWSAAGLPPFNGVRPGVTVPVKVMTILPADRANLIALEVLPPTGYRPKGSLPLLRFVR